MDGGLNQETRQALDVHLDRCEDCTQLVADLAELISAPTARTPEAGEPRVAPRKILGGRYKILRMVGRGGMGSVHEAFDESLGRKVAIKVLRSDFAPGDHRTEQSARLLREARLLAAVHHPNVLSVYDVGIVEGQVYMVTQYVEGSTLREWIRDSSPDWRVILETYLSVGDGLELSVSAIGDEAIITISIVVIIVSSIIIIIS